MPVPSTPFLGREGELAEVLSLLSSEDTRLPWLTSMNDETLPKIRSQLDEAAFAEAWEQGRRLTVDKAVALALDSLE